MLRVRACDVGRLAIFLMSVPLFWSASYGQSLGDVARETRQKQQTKDGHASAKKVVTDEDMPAHAEGDSDSPASHEENHVASTATPKSSMTADQWKAQISAQKHLIAAMQKQADKLAASIHFVEANAYRNGAQYNQVQARKQERLSQWQQEIGEQKSKLQEMQESARQAGFGNAVYDPE